MFGVASRICETKLAEAMTQISLQETWRGRRIGQIRAVAAAKILLPTEGG